MKSDQQLIERLNAAYGDVVDAAPLAPEWERASGQIMPLDYGTGRSRRWFSVPRLVVGFAATIIVVGLVALALSGDGSERLVAGPDPSKVVPRSEMPEWVLSAIGGANEFQAGLLADDLLTFEEYESAYVAYAACASENGAWVPGDVSWDAERYDFSVIVGNDVDGGPGVNAAIDRCWRDTVGLLQDFWVWQKDGRLTATEESERDAATMTSLIDCLSRHGFDIPVDDQQAQNAALEQAYNTDRDTYLQCRGHTEQ